MYEVNGIRFRLNQRTEEGLRDSRRDIYNKLQNHKIKDNDLFLRFDDVVKLFEPNHPYGRGIKELKELSKLNEMTKCEEKSCGHCKHLQIDGMFGMWCDKGHNWTEVEYCSDWER